MRPKMKTIVQQEKNIHLSYLRDFRVEQCSLFQQHKCTHHRPYTCFHWHFRNQRRRRPLVAADGSFNYSADEYCTKYDESTGECAHGDGCVLLHRTAGDTERRYHLRYYKTGVCVHETDSRGLCVKNGAHCAFAHGPDDLRIPVFDRKHLEMMDNGDGDGGGGGGAVSLVPNSLDREHSLICEDPKWQDSSYVLAHYKTEPCKKPPRLCRQGYACPHYHNLKDKRRPPKKFKYRSTPCPSVKQGDEWGDPAGCDQSDSCLYCHSRTEQQFHPEIYKSTRCNDMQQSGYCPRAAFCAFAHIEQESVCLRELLSTERSTLPTLSDIVSSAINNNNNSNNNNTNSGCGAIGDMYDATTTVTAAAAAGGGGVVHRTTIPPPSTLRNSLSDLNHPCLPPLSKLGVKCRTLSGPPAAVSSAAAAAAAAGGNTQASLLAADRDPRLRLSDHRYHHNHHLQQQQQQLLGAWQLPLAAAGGGSTSYSRAPGSERDIEALRRKLIEIDLDPELDTMEKLRRKNGLFASLGAPLAASLPTASLSPVRHLSESAVSCSSGAAVAAAAGGGGGLLGGGAGGGVVGRRDSNGELSDSTGGGGGGGAGMAGQQRDDCAGGGGGDCDDGDDSGSDVITCIDRQLALEEQRQQQQQLADVWAAAAAAAATTHTTHQHDSTAAAAAALSSQLVPGISNAGVMEQQVRLVVGECESRVQAAAAVCDRWRHLAEEQQSRAALAERQLDDTRRHLSATQRDLDCYRRELLQLQPVITAAAAAALATTSCSEQPPAAAAAVVSQQLRTQLLSAADRLNQLVAMQGVCSVQHNNTMPSTVSTDNGANISGAWLL